ncbi:hypothetical protein HK101_010586, partial [Irineochytrium annulatum]
MMQFGPGNEDEDSDDGEEDGENTDSSSEAVPPARRRRRKEYGDGRFELAAKDPLGRDVSPIKPSRAEALTETAEPKVSSRLEAVRSLLAALNYSLVLDKIVEAEILNTGSDIGNIMELKWIRESRMLLFVVLSMLCTKMEAEQLRGLFLIDSDDTAAVYHHSIYHLRNTDEVIEVLLQVHLTLLDLRRIPAWHEHDPPDYGAHVKLALLARGAATHLVTMFGTLARDSMGSIEVRGMKAAEEWFKGLARGLQKQIRDFERNEHLKVLVATYSDLVHLLPLAFEAPLLVTIASHPSNHLRALAHPLLLLKHLLTPLLRVAIWDPRGAVIVSDALRTISSHISRHAYEAAECGDARSMVLHLVTFVDLCVDLFVEDCRSQVVGCVMLGKGVAGSLARWCTARFVGRCAQLFLLPLLEQCVGSESNWEVAAVVLEQVVGDAGWGIVDVAEAGVGEVVRKWLVEGVKQKNTKGEWGVGMRVRSKEALEKMRVFDDFFNIIVLRICVNVLSDARRDSSVEVRVLILRLIARLLGVDEANKGIETEISDDRIESLGILYRIVRGHCSEDDVEADERIHTLKGRIVSFGQQKHMSALYGNKRTEKMGGFIGVERVEAEVKFQWGDLQNEERGRRRRDLLGKRQISANVGGSASEMKISEELETVNTSEETSDREPKAIFRASRKALDRERKSSRSPRRAELLPKITPANERIVVKEAQRIKSPCKRLYKAPERSSHMSPTRRSNPTATASVLKTTKSQSESLKVEDLKTDPQQAGAAKDRNNRSATPPANKIDLPLLADISLPPNPFLSHTENDEYVEPPTELIDDPSMLFRRTEKKFQDVIDAITAPIQQMGRASVRKLTEEKVSLGDLVQEQEEEVRRIEKDFGESDDWNPVIRTTDLGRRSYRTRDQLAGLLNELTAQIEGEEAQDTKFLAKSVYEGPTSRSEDTDVVGDASAQRAFSKSAGGRTSLTIWTQTDGAEKENRKDMLSVVAEKPQPISESDDTARRPTTTEIPLGKLSVNSHEIGVQVCDEELAGKEPEDINPKVAGSWDKEKSPDAFEEDNSMSLDEIMGQNSEWTKSNRGSAKKGEVDLDDFLSGGRGKGSSAGFQSLTEDFRGSDLLFGRGTNKDFDGVDETERQRAGRGTRRRIGELGLRGLSPIPTTPGSPQSFDWTEDDIPMSTPKRGKSGAEKGKQKVLLDVSSELNTPLAKRGIHSSSVPDLPFASKNNGDNEGGGKNPGG